MLIIEMNIDKALDRIQKCLSSIKNKYINSINNKVLFNPYHSGQYTIFLYYLANTIYQCSDSNFMEDKVYYLNKIMNGIDWCYQIELPEFFSIEHPIGSVLGRAKYSNYLFIYQHVTIGGMSVRKAVYPKIGENVLIYSNSTILGDTVIGDNVIISSGCLIKNEIIPNCSLVFGQSPNLLIKSKDLEYMKENMPHWKQL